MTARLGRLLDPPCPTVRPNRTGWHWIIPVVLCLAVVLILAAIGTLGWERTWTSLGVPSMLPAYADMRSVQGGLLSLSQGLDPQVENPGDPWGRRMNYPSVWLAIAQFLQLDVEANYIAFVTASLAPAMLAILYISARFPSIWLLAFSLSSGILMGFERGNNDLVVFALVVAACFVPAAVAIGLVALSGVLKVFPLMAGAMFADSKPRLAIFAAAAAVVAALLLPELSRISVGIPQQAGFSYGSGSLSAAAAEVGLAIPSLVFSGVVVVLAAALHLIAYRPEASARGLEFSAEERLFMAGGGIFLSTFLLTANFDYRLIFVSLCIPYVLTRAGWLRHATLILAVVSANFTPMLWHLGVAGAAANAACKTALFVCIAYYFLKIARPTILGWLGKSQNPR